ncbi:MAG: NADH-quinone oxidoreductase subunit C [Vicinamibacterales bacterium]
MSYEQARTLIGERFTSAQVDPGTPERRSLGEGGPLVVTLPADQWLPFATFAKETLGCRFFSFLTAVDWKDQGIDVLARLDNLDTTVSVTMKTRLAAGVSQCDSLAPVYRGANWMERECYDMFGIRFDGHPDLRRILLADDWQGYPLLKSYAVDTPYPPYR